jgi:putative transcriptional regulator
MRVPTILLTSVFCAASAAVVVGYATAPFHGAAHACGADGEAELGGDTFSFPARAPGLVGQVLIAAPELRDPAFAGTMIYMLAHDDEGALGVVLNRPRHQIRPGVMLWDGGPVGRDRVFVLHDDLSHPGSVVVNDVAVATEPALLNDLLDGESQLRARIFVGYAGWGPGQLAREIAAGAWIVAEPARGFVIPY